MIRPAAAAGSCGAGVTADVTRRAAARIADICTPARGCRYPRWCDRRPI